MRHLAALLMAGIGVGVALVAYETFATMGNLDQLMDEAAD